MPSAGPQTSLQRVVVGTCFSFLLIEVKEIRCHRARHAIAVDTIATQIRSGNLPLARLVDIEELKQLRPGRSHVSDLKHRLAAYLLLEVQIEVLDVGRAHVGIDGEEIPLRAVSGIDRLPGRESHACRRAGGKRLRSQPWIRRSGTKDAIPGQVAQKNILRKRVVE